MQTALRPLLALLCLTFVGCARYPQDAPQTVFASARKMVQEGHAERLTDLIYADSKDMRAFLDQVGGMLGSLQELALSVNKAYPKEIAALKADAEAAAKDGRATGFLEKVAGQMAQGRRRGAQADPDQMQATMSNAFKELFADPYGWLERSESRISIVSTGDDSAAIQWDGKPAFGVGLAMKLEGGRWYIVPPTNLPFLSSVMPKSKDGWEILGNVVEIGDNLIVDLTTDVKQGKCKRLEDLAANAGDKALLPMALGFLAFEKYQESQRPPKPPRNRNRGNPPAAPAQPAPATGASPSGG